MLFTNLGGPRLQNGDEKHCAICAREMLQRGDPVVPTFNGQLCCQRPALMYWSLMASQRVLGVSEFSARLPSALFAIGTVLCTYLMGRRLFGPQAGVWAAIALTSGLMFALSGRMATPQSLLVFTTTLALTIYVLGTFQPRFETTPLDSPARLRSPGQFFPRHWSAAVFLYAAVGLAVMAGGIIGLILPLAAIGMSLLVLRLPPQRDEAWTLHRIVPAVLRPFEPRHAISTVWQMRPLTAAFAIAAIALPWFLAVGLATEGEFYRQYFLGGDLRDAAELQDAGWNSPLYFLVSLLLGFFPWSLFLVPLTIDLCLQLRRSEGLNPGFVLVACWVATQLVLLPLAHSKPLDCPTICCPALALLTGSYVDRWSRHATVVAGRWLLVAFGGLAALGAAFMLAVPLVSPPSLPGGEWLGLIGLMPLAGGIVCLGLAALRNYRASAAVFGASAVALAVLLCSVAAPDIGNAGSTRENSAHSGGAPTIDSAFSRRLQVMTGQ